MDELAARFGLYCPDIPYLNPYTPSQLSALEQATDRLAALRRKDPTTRLFIQAARWNQRTDKKGVVHRWAGGGPGPTGLREDRVKQDTSLGLPRNEAEYLRLLAAKHARPPTSPRPAAHAPHAALPDSSLTSIASSPPLTRRPSLVANDDSGGEPARAQGDRRGTQTAPGARRVAVSASRAQAPAPPTTMRKSANAASRDTATASFSQSSGRSYLGFPVVKRAGKEREKPAAAAGAEKGTKRKSRRDKSTSPPRVEGAQLLRRETEGQALMDESVVWDADDSMELEARKGRAGRQKMRSCPGGLDDVGEISVLQGLYPPSFPTDLATSTPRGKKRAVPPILKSTSALGPPLPPPTSELELGPLRADVPPAQTASRTTSRSTCQGSPMNGKPARGLLQPPIPTEPGTPMNGSPSAQSSRSPSSHSLPTPPKRRRHPHLLAHSSALGFTSSDSHLGTGPTSSVGTKLSADDSLPFSLGLSQVDRRVDEVREFLHEEERIDDWDA